LFWTRGKNDADFGTATLAEHDPEKRSPVFGKDHAQSKSESLIRFNSIGSDSGSFSTRAEHSHVMPAMTDENSEIKKHESL
jgi:hypothetical protein